MEPLPNPNRCIWCLKEPPEITFDESHVLPSCLGNHHQQVLPPGVVCKSCNSFFGSQIEPILLRDPIFHAIVVFLQPVDPDDMTAFRTQFFDNEHPPVGVPVRGLNLKVDVQPLELALDVNYSISGRLTKTYSERDLKKLSRAIHKIAFESFAWVAYVKGAPEPVDIFSSAFDPVRIWAREGQPQNFTRPVLRRPASEISAEWIAEIWKFENDYRVQLNLFGDWFGVSLNSRTEETLGVLTPWGKSTPQVWCISETMRKL